MNASRSAIYAGTFDPPTLGHLNLIERGANLFDNLVVAVARETTKDAAFTPAERVELLRRLTEHLPNVTVEEFSGLLVEYARKRQIPVILRGMRPGADFEYEFQMALTNRQLAPELDTLFLMTSAEHMYVSSTLVKQIVSLGGKAESMVPKIVEEALEKKFGL